MKNKGEKCMPGKTLKTKERKITGPPGNLREPSTRGTSAGDRKNCAAQIDPNAVTAPRALESQKTKLYESKIPNGKRETTKPRGKRDRSALFNGNRPT